MSQKIDFKMFRSVFPAIDKEKLNWFPGHMVKGLKQMQHKLRQVDCIIEVHDARIPFSGRNTEFKHTVSGLKPHILLLNKCDLVPYKLRNIICDRIKPEYEHVIFTNCRNPKCEGIAKVFPLAQRLISDSCRYNRSEADDYSVMIIGVPNVGKSSLINLLRSRHLQKGGRASAVGAKPGITRSVLHKIKISENPLCFMLDTPGVLTPNIPNTDVGLKLVLCSTIEDHIVGVETVADYLLYWLNKNGHFDYVKHLHLEKASDNILDILLQICRTKKMYIKIRNELNEYQLKPHLNEAAHTFLKDFRSGSLGKYVLDEDIL